MGCLWAVLRLAVGRSAGHPFQLWHTRTHYLATGRVGMPSQHICGRLKDTCICTLSCRRHSCLCFGMGSTKGLPVPGGLYCSSWYWAMQRQAWSEQEQRCSFGAGRDFAWTGETRELLYIRCTSLGCLASRKTSVCYKFSLAKGHFLCLKGNHALWCLRLEWLDCQKNGICFFFSLSDCITWPKAEGKNSLSFKPSSEVCISVWGYVLPLQTQPHWKLRLSTVYPMDNFGSAPFGFFQSSVCANNEQTVSTLYYLRKPRLEGSLQNFLNKLLVLSITAPTNN